MARKAGKRITKRLTVDIVKIPKKEKKFIVKPRGGKTVALGVVLRDMLHLADTMHEIKKILNKREVLVDRKVVLDKKYPIGFMDVISIPPIDKHYQCVYDKKGRLELKEIPKNESNFKLCKVLSKSIQKKSKVQLHLHDGKNILSDKDIALYGTLKLSLPELKIIDNYPLARGSISYVIGGKHAGEIAIIKEIVQGTQRREALVVLESDGKNFQTRRDYVFVLGVKESAVKI